MDNCLAQQQQTLMQFAQYQEPPNYEVFSAPQLRLDQNMNEQIGLAFNACRKFMHIGFLWALNLIFAVYTIFRGFAPFFIE